MKVAVTGATGHLGNVIVRELHARGHSIKALIRGTELKSLEGLQVEIIQGDLFDTAALQKMMSGCDALIHTAAIISLSGGMDGLVHRTNVEGTRYVMDMAKATGIKRVIHISSIHAFEQKPIDTTLDEHQSLAADHAFAYDLSKRDSQQLALSYTSPGMEVLALCPTSVLGPFDFRPSKLGKAILQMCSGKLPFVFKGGFDFCDVRDIATAVVNALVMGRSGQSYLLGGKWYTLTAFYEMVTSAAGKRRKPFVIHPLLAYAGIPFVVLGGWMTRREPFYTHEAIIAVTDGNRHISHDKATAELNYHPRSLEETIRDTYDWFLKNGYLD